MTVAELTSLARSARWRLIARVLIRRSAMGVGIAALLAAAAWGALLLCGLSAPPMALAALAVGLLAALLWTLWRPPSRQAACDELDRLNDTHELIGTALAAATRPRCGDPGFAQAALAMALARVKAGVRRPDMLPRADRRLLALLAAPLLLLALDQQAAVVPATVRSGSAIAMLVGEDPATSSTGSPRHSQPGSAADAASGDPAFTWSNPTAAGQSRGSDPGEPHAAVGGTGGGAGASQRSLSAWMDALAAPWRGADQTHAHSPGSSAGGGAQAADPTQQAGGGGTVAGSDAARPPQLTAEERRRIDDALAAGNIDPRHRDLVEHYFSR